MGHFKHSHGEICNSVTYIPSSRSSSGTSTDLSSGVRKSSVDVHAVSDSGSVRTSLEVVVRNRLGSSPRRSPHNISTVSPHTQDIMKHPAGLCRQVKTRKRGDSVRVLPPDEGADNKLAVQKRKKEKGAKKNKFKKEAQKITNSKFKNS